MSETITLTEAGKLSPADCERLTGHVFERTGFSRMGNPAQHQEKCRVCGRVRWAIARHPFEYRYEES